MISYALIGSYKVFQTVCYTVALVIVGLCLCKCRNYNEEIYTVETDYLRWATRVPAFTVCPAVSGRFVRQQITRYDKNSLLNAQNVTFFLNLLRPKKMLCLGCPVRGIGGLPTGNLSALSAFLTPPCESQFIRCSWNGVFFPCCQHFHPFKTRHGLCYSLNSEQTAGYPIKEPINLLTSFKEPKAELLVEAPVPFSMHIHERKATTFQKPKFNIPKGKLAVIYYRFTETIALESAKSLLPTQRRCVLDEEKSLAGFKAYHYSSCKANCLVKKQLEVCGCRHDLLRGDGDVCGIEGLLCLDTHRANFTKLKCGCQQTCTGQQIKFVYASLQQGDKNNKTASAYVLLTKPPTERDIYYAKTTILDTLVGFVCLTRLITTADLYDIIIGLWTLLQNYMFALNFLRIITMRLFKFKRE